MSSTVPLTKTTMTSVNTHNSLIVSDNKQFFPLHLNTGIAQIAKHAIEARGAFTIALSGESLSSLLAQLSDVFGEDPQWEKWHVLLADECMVPDSHPESNYGTLRAALLTKTKIPHSQIYGPPLQTISGEPAKTTDVAIGYEQIVHQVLDKFSDGRLDLAVLGFGPDGHTCGLYPGHPMLEERVKWVAPILYNRVPPFDRITLTLSFLNNQTRHVILYGTGKDKGPVLKQSMEIGTVGANHQSEALVKGATAARGRQFEFVLRPNLPCAAIEPSVLLEKEPNTLTWIVDNEAMTSAGILSH